MTWSRGGLIQAWVFTRRALLPQRSRWLGLTLSVALGVAGIVSVEGTLEVARTSLYQEARDLLGADLKVSSSRPLDDTWSKRARALLLKSGEVAEVIELASMAQPLVSGVSHDPLLVSLKGVSDSYPLRGALRISSIGAQGALERSSVRRASDLKAEEVWVAPIIWERLSSLKEIKSPAEPPFMRLGDKTFRVAGVIRGEPDSGFTGSLSFAPRVLIRRAALDALNLVRQGSRARRSILFASRAPSLSGGPSLERPSDVDSAWSPPRESTRSIIRETVEQLRADVPLHIKVQSFNDAQPNTLLLFERIGLFFLMISLVALCLCLIALTSGAWGMISDLLPLSITARSLGVSAQVISRSYSGLFTLVGLLGAGLGLLLGWLIQLGLSLLLATELGVNLTPSLSGTVIFMALGLGWGMCLSVNLLVQRGLSRHTVGALISSEPSPHGVSVVERAVAVICTLVMIGAYVSISSGSYLLGAGFSIVLLSLLALSGALVEGSISLARLALALSNRSRGVQGVRFALRQLLGDLSSARTSLCTLGVSGALIGGLVLVTDSLDRALTLDLESAPQLFLIDIQSDQREIVRTTFEELKLTPPLLRSLIRARITELNGEPITRGELTAKRPAGQLRARSLSREYNLTTQRSLSDTEELVEGRWWSLEEGSRSHSRLVSVEQRLAQRLGLRVGGEVTFDLQGREITFQVQSIREVDWLSFKPNFLFTLSPGAMTNAPKTWIGAASLNTDAELSILSARLFKRAPNVSLIDLRPALKEGRSLLSTLSAALRFTGLVCICAGLLSMLGNLRRERERRARSVRLLTALGVSQRSAYRWVMIELTLLGALGALTCIIGMWGCGLIATRALNIPLAPTGFVFGITVAICTLAPLLASWRFLNADP